MIEFKFQSRGHSRVSRRIRRAARLAQNPIQVHQKIAIWLFRWVQKNFESEGGNVGGWPPFKHGGRLLPSGGVDTSAKLLQDTGRLRQSMQIFFSSRTAGIGSHVPYSLFHEEGLPTGKLPQRRMLPRHTDKEVTDAVLRIYGAEFRRVTR